jgi:hypothetical protein
MSGLPMSDRRGRAERLAVIPAEAGISGREVSDLLHETPAFAGVTFSSSVCTHLFRALLPSARALAGEGEAAGVSATPHRPRSCRAPSLPRLFVPAFAGLVLLAGCATQSGAAVAPAAPGFLLGLWHGFIFPVAWLLSLFMPDVSVYAVPNNGGWYDFGYFIGIVFLGVGARSARRGS